MADKNYFHSTPYKFQPEAYREVIQRFNTIIQDVSVRCWYDVDLDMFEMVCPPSAAEGVDDKLREVIDVYIREELRFSQLERRKVLVRLFIEDEPDSDEEEVSETKDPGASDYTTAQPKPVIQHIINMEGADNALVKLFGLRDLPKELVHRALPPLSSRQATQAINQGLTCRAIFLNKRKEPEYNGRIGKPIPKVGATAEAALLSLAPFRPLHNGPTYPKGEEVLTKPKTILHNPFSFRHQDTQVTHWLEGIKEPIRRASDDRPMPVPRTTLRVGPADEVLPRANPTERVETFPSFGNNYAVVDRNGLTSNARNQARWEHQNFVSQRRSRDESAIARSSYAQPLSNSNEEGTTSHISRSYTWDGEPSLITASHETMTPQLRTESPAQNPAVTRRHEWTTNILRPNAESDSLLGDLTCISTKSSTVRCPPGFENALPQDRAQSIRNPTQGDEVKIRNLRIGQGSDPILQTTDDLIDFGTENGIENENNRAQPRIIGPPPGFSGDSRMILEPTKQELPSRIVETLANPDKPLSLRNTMRQQAGKRELKKRIPPRSSTLTKTQDQSPDCSDDSIEEVDKPQSEIVPNEGVVQLDVCADQLQFSWREVQFGTALIWKEDKTFRRGHLNAENTQSKLNSTAVPPLSTEFIPKLSNSISDGLHLLDFAPEDAEMATAIFYEVQAYDSGGQTVSFEFRADNDGNDSMLPLTSTVVQETYMHYPFRIWDARILLCSNSQVPPQVKDFVSSIQQADCEPPSFHARVPSIGLTIERILVKRCFVKNISDGYGYLRVMDVQELFLKPIESGQYEPFNLSAHCESRDRMMNEGRQWLEASMLFKDTMTTEEVIKVANEFVSRMDGVGYHNEGPLVKKESVPKKETVIPFW